MKKIVRLETIVILRPDCLPPLCQGNPVSIDFFLNILLIPVRDGHKPFADAKNVFQLIKHNVWFFPNILISLDLST